MSAPSFWCAGSRHLPLAAGLAIADADVPARGGRADRRPPRRQGLWPSRRARAVAHDGADRHEPAARGLHPAAQGAFRRPSISRRCPRTLVPPAESGKPVPGGAVVAARLSTSAARCCGAALIGGWRPISRITCGPRDLDANRQGAEQDPDRGVLRTGPVRLQARGRGLLGGRCPAAGCPTRSTAPPDAPPVSPSCARRRLSRDFLSRRQVAAGLQPWVGGPSLLGISHEGRCRPRQSAAVPVTRNRSPRRFGAAPRCPPLPSLACFDPARHRTPRCAGCWARRYSAHEIRARRRLGGWPWLLVAPRASCSRWASASCASRCARGGGC